MALAPLRTEAASDTQRTTARLNGDTDIAVVGAMLADPRRCRILLALDDGRARPAGQLAAEAGVTPATASSHLAKMVEAGLLTVEARGRNRFYQLSGPQIGRVLGLLSELATAAPIRSLRRDARAQMRRETRTCSDH